MRCIVIPVDGPPAVHETGGTAYSYLKATFPDGFDGISLGPDVIGYVGDESLIDGSTPNLAAKTLADDIYQAVVGRCYHTPVCGPMVIFGLSRESGNSTDVPAKFLAAHGLEG